MWLNHHTSRTSSALVLLFFPLYALISAVTVRTAILTGRLNPDLGHTLPGRLTLTREGLWFSSLGIGFIAFGFELYCPETQWKAWRAPWSGGKIRLEDDEESDTVAEPKLDDEVESPVATANIYERLTFSWLTRE